MIDNPVMLTVDALIWHGDRVLLVKRGQEPHKGSFALPGGFLEAGESAEIACVRELQEETGLRICASDLTLFGVYSEANRDPRGHTVSIVYSTSVSDMERLLPGSDAASAVWVQNYDCLDLAFDHKKILDDFFNSNG